MSCLHHLFTTMCKFLPFGTTVIKCLQFQGKRLYGGVESIIQILSKLLSNMSSLFIPIFRRDKIIDKIWIITIMVPWVSSTFEI